MKKMIISFTSKRTLIQLTVLLLIIVVFCFVSLRNSQLNSSDISVFLTFAVNIVISAFLLIRAARKHPYSFQVLFWMFGLVFFGIAPLVQFLNRWAPWNLIYENTEIINCNLLILLWYICFVFGSKIRLRFIFVKKQTTSQNANRLSKTGVDIAVFFTVLFSGILIVTNGITGLFFRGARVAISDSSTIALLSYHVFKNTILFTFAVLLQNVKVNYQNRKLCFVIGTLFFITCFPTGLSRYMLGAYYLGLLILFAGRKKIGVWFTILVFLGLTITFPVMSVFRSFSGFQSYDSFIDSIGPSLNGAFLTANYDTHNMIITSMHYIAAFGFSWGRQLMGAILFFIPRSVWPTKPIGSGAMAISALNMFGFTNVSMPLIGEAFINFGIIGVVLFAIITGWCTSLIDFEYWKGADNLRPISIIYPFSIFYFFFLLRGDMMSGGAYLIANVVVGMLLTKLMLRR